MKKRILLSVFVLLLCCITCFSQEQIRRQVIIVADQTISRNPRMSSMYDAIKDWIQGEDPKVSKSSEVPDLRFNSDVDDISLFAFAMTGDDVAKIQGTNKSYTAETLLEDFSSALIKKRSSFRSSGKQLNEFLDNDMKSLFDGSDELSKRWFESSPYSQYRCTMSHFVYPTILRQIDKTTSMSECILIVVSDFASGAASERDGKDENNLKDMMGTKFDTVKKLMNEIGKPYERIKYLRFDISDASMQNSNSNNISANQNNGVVAIGSTLKIRSMVVRSPLNIMADLSLKQKSYQGDAYSINSVDIFFDKGDNTSVKKIELNVLNNAGKDILFSEVIADSVTADSWYDSQRKVYRIEAQNLNLGALAVGDSLVFVYNFYTISKDETGKELVPMVLAAPRTVIVDDKVLATGNGWMYVVLLLLLSAAAGISYWGWRRRGKNRDVDLSVKINPISKMRFMDVKEDDDNLHVLDYDCWYIDLDGVGRPIHGEANIHIQGHVSLVSKSFARKYALKVSYKVADLDENFDFSFRPDGKEYDGHLKEKDRIYDIENISADGTFSFDAVAYVEPGLSPDFINRDNVLKLGIYIRVDLIDQNQNSIRILKEVDYSYEFIARPRISNLDLWVAFDPGTSGSCVAFGKGGTPGSTDNIHLALNKVGDSTGEYWMKIFPSKIRINDREQTINKIRKGNIEDMMECLPNQLTGDYWFGNQAQIRWGKNSFQSIKKLLGYANELTIRQSNGKEEKVKGKDLALLLVKGLINHVIDYLKYEQSNNSGMAGICNSLLQNGSFSPSRAIVTVPNNYTLIKIRDMVESVKRTNHFKEVHYLYEAEGVLMSYFHKNWSCLSQKQTMAFIVFDMGGATINATAFKIKVNEKTKTKKNGEVNRYIDTIEVSTVSKVGYSVGGDDIDYALMKAIYDIPSVKESVEKIYGTREDHQKTYKTKILKHIEKLKIDLIERAHSEENKGEMKVGNSVKDLDRFWQFITTMFTEAGKISIPVKPSENDEEYIKDEHKNHCQMTKYVYDKVQDAVRELMNCRELKNQTIEMIFSGRSSLYPGIERTAIEVIKDKEYGCRCDGRWKGFDKDGTGIMDEEKVKTAVAQGACWYAMWRKHIIMRHDIVTSTFGYIDMENNFNVFVPVVEKNSDFKNGYAENEVEVMTPTLQNVLFLQMLGTNYNDIIKKDIRYKKNPIVEVTNDDIHGELKKIKIRIDDKNNFSYVLTIAGQQSLEGKYVAADTDILDENSDAYAFAAINPETKTEKTGGLG